MRVLVAGREGQLAKALLEGKTDHNDVICVGRPDLDITNRSSIERVLRENQVNAVINAAAYTAVDMAEGDEAAAFAINATGAENLAKVAADHGLPVVQVSTDYVFSGEKPAPYTEADQTGPLGAYGRSKLAGELMVSAANPAHIVLRTAWIYSAQGHNFLRTMLRLAKSREEISVVDDQVGSPTYARDLARGILLATRTAVESPAATSWRGIFNLAGAGSASWADFAEYIFLSTRNLGGATARVKRIGTIDFPTPAVRPANSSLDCTLFNQAFGFTMPDWRSGTERCLAELSRAESGVATDTPKSPLDTEIGSSTVKIRP